MLEVLSSNKPIVLGIKIFDSFMNLDRGNAVMTLPDKDDAYVGGHAVAVVGYKLDPNAFLIKNSFGSSWGDNGYCWMPFDYVLQQSFEKWCFDIVDTSNILL